MYLRTVSRLKTFWRLKKHAGTLVSFLFFSPLDASLFGHQSLGGLVVVVEAKKTDVNHLESQTPAPTNPTPGATTPRLSLPPSSTDQSHHGFPSEIGQNPPPGGSTAFNSQLDQPPESPRRNRRRRRFVQWIRRRFRYHGPWVPGMQRNRNNVSNPIARVDRVFPQSS